MPTPRLSSTHIVRNLILLFSLLLLDTQCRYLVSLYLRKNKDAAFEEGISFSDIVGALYEEDIKTFCKEVVEEMSVDARDVVQKALPEALGASVRLVYLDRREGNDVFELTFGSSGSAKEAPDLCVLLKPGHYDIVYERMQ